MLNISRNKVNQAVKFVQLVEYNMGNIFLKKSCTKMVKKLVPDPLQKIKINIGSGSTIWNIIQFVLLWWCVSKSRSMKISSSLFFLFEKGGLDLVSVHDFLHNFWRKVFLTLYYINWPNLIVWLPLLVELLGNMLILDICNPVCDSINFDINLSLFIKILSYMAKKAGQKFKYPENEKGFWHEIKTIILHLNKLSFAWNCPRI